MIRRRQEIKEKEGTSPEQIKRMVRLKINKAVKNPRVRLGKEDKRINSETVESRRTNPDGGGG